MTATRQPPGLYRVLPSLQPALPGLPDWTDPHPTPDPSPPAITPAEALLPTKAASDDPPFAPVQSAPAPPQPEPVPVPPVPPSLGRTFPVPPPAPAVVNPVPLPPGVPTVAARPPVPGAPPAAPVTVPVPPSTGVADSAVPAATPPPAQFVDCRFTGRTFDGYPAYPPGLPCVVTRDEAARGDPRADSRDFRSELAEALSRAALSKDRRLLRQLAARPAVVNAVLMCQSEGVRNLIDLEYGTVDGRPAQGYGLGVISEKWLASLFSQRLFLIGEDASRELSVPDKAQYQAAARLVPAPECFTWIVLYCASMEAQLGNFIQFNELPSPKAAASASDRRAADRAATLAGVGNALAVWLWAWFRFGSREAAVSVINGDQLPWSRLRDHLGKEGAL